MSHSLPHRTLRPAAAALCLVLAWNAAACRAAAGSWLENIGIGVERTEPKYQNITFWDTEEGVQRGARVFLYTVPENFENRQLDARFHDRLKGYLDSFCYHVADLNTISDKNRRRMTENAILEMVEDWQTGAAIDPRTLANAAPFFDVDAVILMERTHYDQVWKGMEKRLLIGVNIGVFDMEYGDPLYLDRVTIDAEWFGERASYLNAERAALLTVADNIGERFHLAAEAINQARGDELEAARRAARERDRAAAADKANLEQSHRVYIRNLERFLAGKDRPPEIVEPIRANLERFRHLLEMYAETLTPEQRDELAALRERINGLGERYDDWLEANWNAGGAGAPPPADSIPMVPERVAAPAPAGPMFEPLSAEPIQNAGNAVGFDLPSIPDGAADPSDRSWLLPQTFREAAASAPGAETNPATGAIQSATPALRPTPAPTRPAPRPTRPPEQDITPIPLPPSIPDNLLSPGGSSRN